MAENWHLRIMCAASIQARVGAHDVTDFNPSIVLVIRLMKR